MKLFMYFAMISPFLLNASFANAQAITPVDANFALVNEVPVDDENCPGVIYMNPEAWGSNETPEFISILYPMNPVRALPSSNVNSKTWEIDLVDFSPVKLQITVTLTAPHEFTWTEVAPGSSIPVCQLGEYQSKGVTN